MDKIAPVLLQGLLRLLKRPINAPPAPTTAPPAASSAAAPGSAFARVGTGARGTATGGAGSTDRDVALLHEASYGTMGALARRCPAVFVSSVKVCCSVGTCLQCTPQTCFMPRGDDVSCAMCFLCVQIPTLLFDRLCSEPKSMRLAIAEALGQVCVHTHHHLIAHNCSRPCLG